MKRRGLRWAARKAVPDVLWDPHTRRRHPVSSLMLQEAFQYWRFNHPGDPKHRDDSYESVMRALTLDLTAANRPEEITYMGRHRPTDAAVKRAA